MENSIKREWQRAGPSSADQEIAAKFPQPIEQCVRRPFVISLFQQMFVCDLRFFVRFLLEFQLRAAV